MTNHPLICKKCGASWDENSFPYSGVFLFYLKGDVEADDGSNYESLESLRAEGVTEILSCPKDSFRFDPSLDRGDPYPNRGS